MIEVIRTETFDAWLRKLKDRAGRLRIIARLDRLSDGNPGDVKPVGNGVWELRMTFGPGYRIYYVLDGPRIVLLLCGGDKSTQRRDIEKAYELAEEYKNEESLDHGEK